MKTSIGSYNKIRNKRNEILKVIKRTTGENLHIEKTRYIFKKIYIYIYIFKRTKFKEGNDVDKITKRSINARQSIE